MGSIDDRSGARIIKTPTGIVGLDSITQGGLPQSRITIVEGGPGTGKTLLALQSLVHAAEQLGEPGIFIAFEESSTRIIANAATFGWDLPALQKKNLLFFVDAQPNHQMLQSGSFDLAGLLAVLDAKMQQMQARHVVFDAIDIVLSMLDDTAVERRELYRISDWATSKSASIVVTSKAAPLAPQWRWEVFLQFMADCAILLNHRIVNGVSQRSLRVLKYRGSGFHENQIPYLIGPNGFDVASVSADADHDVPITGERLSSGVGRLDTMLGGGYFRGAGILVTGAPGTAKTTLSGAFAEAACQRQESTLYVSFDSDTGEVVRNLTSVGIKLARFIGKRGKRGLLHMARARAINGSAETHLLQIRAWARDHNARCVVIDPVSALAFGNEEVAQGVAKRLMDWAKAEGITLFCTSLLSSGEQNVESSPLQISTIADTWIHLSYLVRGGERNRCLSIIKSRGTAHSNQVRELLLSERGVTLADAYSADGEVLMGTLRWERERAEELAQRKLELDEQYSRLELVAADAELSSRLAELQRELDAKRARLKLLTEAAADRSAAVAGQRSGRLARRGADS